jgi:hypothetical protein
MKPFDASQSGFFVARKQSKLAGLSVAKQKPLAPTKEERASFVSDTPFLGSAELILSSRLLQEQFQKELLFFAIKRESFKNHVSRINIQALII